MSEQQTTEVDAPTPLLDALEEASRDLLEVPEWARPTLRLSSVIPSESSAR